MVKYSFDKCYTLKQELVGIGNYVMIVTKVKCRWWLYLLLIFGIKGGVWKFTIEKFDVY